MTIVWYSHTIEYYTAVRMNELQQHITTWMDLGSISAKRYILHNYIYHDILYKVKKN